MPSAAHVSRVSQAHEAGITLLPQQAHALALPPRRSALLATHASLSGPLSSASSLTNSHHGPASCNSPRHSAGPGGHTTASAAAHSSAAGPGAAAPPSVALAVVPSASSLSSLSSHLGLGGLAGAGGGLASGQLSNHMLTASSLSSMGSHAGLGLQLESAGSTGEPRGLAAPSQVKYSQEAGQQQQQQAQPHPPPQSQPQHALALPEQPRLDALPGHIVKDPKLPPPLPLPQPPPQQQRGRGARAARSLSASLPSFSFLTAQHHHRGSDGAWPADGSPGGLQLPPQPVPQPPPPLTVAHSPRRRPWQLSPFSTHCNTVVPTAKAQGLPPAEAPLPAGGACSSGGLSTAGVAAVAAHLLGGSPDKAGSGGVRAAHAGAPGEHTLAHIHTQA